MSGYPGGDGPVFVTGGSGFVGRAVVERLVAAGRTVRALSRSAASAELLEDLGVQPVPGDVLDHDRLVDGMRGCRVVYHIAGVNEFCLRDPSRLTLVNVDGSTTVARAALDAGVRRLVHTSSAATLGERSGTTGAEDSPHRGWFLSHYERSKYEAERAVLALGEATGLEVVCVNPASVQGPGRTGGTARILLAHVNGRLRAVVDAVFSVVDVDDCAAGHLLAEAHGRAGQRYVLSGATLRLSEALDVVGRVTGIEDRPWFLPGPLALAAATAVELTARLRGRSPAVCREMVRTMLHGHRYDGSRAVRELGLTYTPPHETLRRTIAWYVENGYVHRELPGLG